MVSTTSPESPLLRTSIMAEDAAMAWAMMACNCDRSAVAVEAELEEPEILASRSTEISAVVDDVLFPITGDTTVISAVLDDVLSPIMGISLMTVMEAEDELVELPVIGMAVARMVAFISAVLLLEELPEMACS